LTGATHPLLPTIKELPAIKELPVVLLSQDHPEFLDRRGGGGRWFFWRIV